MKIVGRLSLAIALAAIGFVRIGAQAPAKEFQGQAVEQFLTKGKILKLASIATGVTGPRKATVEYNGVQHFGVFKTIDVERPGLTQLDNGQMESNFQDTWRTEVAAYEVDKIIGLGLVPATVERVYDDKHGSLQWWIDDSIQEGEREKRNLTPPDPVAWNRLELKTRLFDNLIYNTDRTKENILVTPADFGFYLIDHSRTFRTFKDLKSPKTLTQFSRSLLEGIKKLDKANLTKQTGKYLTGFQITTMLQRRDAIVALANQLVAQKGEAAVLYP